MSYFNLVIMLPGQKYSILLVLFSQVVQMQKETSSTVGN